MGTNESPPRIAGFGCRTARWNSTGFDGATRILGRMPAGVAPVALGIPPPQSLVISGRGIAAAATARPNAGQGRRGPWLPRSRGRPTGPGSTTRASQIRRDDLGGRRIRERTWGGRACRAGPHSTARSGTVCCEGGFAGSTRTIDPSAVPDGGRLTVRVRDNHRIRRERNARRLIRSD